MPAAVSSLRIGAPVGFEDRWVGELAGVDVTDTWDVLNVTIKAGFISAKSVKLPFSTITSWADDSVRVAAESVRAFAQEIPPVAAPSQTLTDRTLTSHSGARFAGLIVRATDRRAEELLLSRRGALYRIAVADVTPGETLTLGVAPENLNRYYADSGMLENLRELIRKDSQLTPDDKNCIELDVQGGEITVGGNVRVDATRRHVQGIVAQVKGATSLRNQLMDDFQVESAVGQALSQAGFSRDAEVSIRSNLGMVKLYGYVPSERAVEDVVRATAKVPGVRQVRTELVVRAPSTV